MDAAATMAQPGVGRCVDVGIMPRDGRANRLAILREIARRESDHEPPPTLAELATLLGLTVPGAQHHVNVMVRMALLRRGPGARWLVMTDAGRARLAEG